MGSTGPASIDPDDRQALGPRLSRSSPSATWCDAQVPLIDHLGIDQLFCVIGGSMGGMQVLEWAASYPEPRVRRRADRHRGAAIRRRTSPSTRSAGRRSWPIPTGAGRRLPASSAREPAQRPRRGAHGRAHHLPFGGGAAAQVRPQPAGPRRARPSASTPTSRSRAICATRARPSSTASTPTATSTSRGRWTISTSPPSTATCWPTPSRAPRRASAWSPSPATGCIPTRESREIVQALNAVGGQRQLRRDRDRQGPRRLPARGAGAVRDRPRLPQRGGRAARLKRGPERADARARRRPSRVDLLLIAEMVDAGSRVLDVGCGDGALLQLSGEPSSVDGARHRARARPASTPAWRAACR